jgi:hypothetical protein
MKQSPKKPAGTPKPLPKVNVEFATGGEMPMTPEKVRGLICNPIYAGVGPYPRLVDEATWVRAATRMIQEDGAEQFLVNMLYVLRKSLGTEIQGSGNA